MHALCERRQLLWIRLIKREQLATIARCVCVCDKDPFNCLVTLVGSYSGPQGILRGHVASIIPIITSESTTSKCLFIIHKLGAMHNMLYVYAAVSIYIYAVLNSQRQQ
jgi:hypothetical protein